jgi:DNA-binding NarL/FixJ family response regulator
VRPFGSRAGVPECERGLFTTVPGGHTVEVRKTLRVAVVEDEPLYRELLVTGLISRMAGITVVGSFTTGEELLRNVDPAVIDVLLIDLDLGPGLDGAQVGVRLRRRRPDLGIVLLSNLAMPGLLAGLPDDVRGGWSYLLKTSVSDIDQLGLAIRESAEGGVVVDPALTRTLVPTTAGPLAALTPRQVEILARVANGWSNKKIAEDLVLSVRTVESVISDVIAALGIPKDGDAINARVSCVLLYLRHTVSRSTQLPVKPSNTPT